MNQREIRAHVSGLYDGHKWATKVARMSDQQVYAIYMKHISERPVPAPEAPTAVDAPMPEQLQLNLKEQ